MSFSQFAGTTIVPTLSRIVLAAAFAETGRFDDAVRWQRAALVQTESATSRRRLARYTSGQPCREPWAAGEKLTAQRLRAEERLRPPGGVAGSPGRRPGM